MIPYQEWKIVCEDDELDVRMDPQDLEGYGLKIKGTEKYILFPRGALKDIALTDRITGKNILEMLIPRIEQGIFFNGTNLTHDSIIAIVTKAYIEKERRLEESLREEDIE